MKVTRILQIAALLMISRVSWACPDLTGKYNCTKPSSTKSKSLKMKQAIQPDGVTVYTVDDLEVITDGAPHKSSRQKNGVITESEVTGECMGNNLLSFSEKAQLLMNGQPAADWILNTRFLKNQDATLTMFVIGVVNMTGNSKQVDEQFTCILE